MRGSGLDLVHAWLAVAAAVASPIALSACSDHTPATVDAGAPPPPPTTQLPAPIDAGVATSQPSSVPTTTYEEETSTRPMEVLKFQFASGVEARQPKDKMVLATPGDRVYAFITLRNRTGRPRQVHFEFRVNGEKRTEMDLDVAESWSYRTWGYNTISPKDKPGKLTLVATDDAGNPLVEETLPIVKKPGK